MKSLKTFGLAAITAGALMASPCAGTASATELTCTSPPGTRVMCQAGTIFHAESVGHVILHAPIGNIECGSTIELEQLNTGSPTETVSLAIRTLTFTGCTNSVTSVLAKGTLEIHTDPADPQGSSGKTGNGTVTSSGTESTVELAGFHCIYKTNSTDFGTLTGASTATNSNKEFTHKATLNVSSTIPRTGGRSGAFCGSSAPLTGLYVFTSPNGGWLDVDHHEAIG